MIKYIGKILLCTLSIVAATIIGGMVSMMLHFEQPALPGKADMRLMGLYTIIAAAILSIALAEVSRRLNANRGARFAAIAWLAYAWLGINNPVEASIFTTIGGGLAIAVIMLFPCLLVAGMVTLLFGQPTTTSPFAVNSVQFGQNRTVMKWAICISAAILAFPAVYFFFGMPVGLIVGKFYQDQAFGLQLPSLGVVVGVQFIRGLVALVAALPVLVVWSGSRQQFAWTFSLSLFVLSGLYGLIQAYWMPWTLRSIHTVELLLDSLAYSWILALVFLQAAPVRRSQFADKEALGALESTLQMGKEKV